MIYRIWFYLLYHDDWTERCRERMPFDSGELSYPFESGETLASGPHGA